MKLFLCCAGLTLCLLVSGCSDSDSAKLVDGAEATAESPKSLRAERDRRIDELKALWGGPLQVEVVETGNIQLVPEERGSDPWLSGDRYYIETKLHVTGEHPQDIIRLVPVELTDNQQLKYWYCNRPDTLRVCDPAIGFTTTVDDSRRPYDLAVEQIKLEYQDIKD